MKVYLTRKILWFEWTILLKKGKDYIFNKNTNTIELKKRYRHVTEMRAEYEKN